MKYTFETAAHVYEIELTQTGEGYRARIGDQAYEISGTQVRPGELHFQVDGNPHNAYWAADGPRRWVTVDGRTRVLTSLLASSHRGEASGGGARGERTILAPMPGQVRAVQVTEGEPVEKGQTLLLLEAMKMEIRIQAGQSGRIARLQVKPGDTVERDQVLAELE